ncbi:phosphate regulon sensor histidine kinase PhoR [Kerstersia gyiorum]|uniref:Phosphate regulon sensor protein PhoR n=1 Tax=Kerstersia gyiorum TaxID=206506 RepID=A0A4Q7N1G0_9BURK|nr:phosphate regulon sensor histidine kinase PhoR [Kerstersia gyiorum]MCO7635807.1 phosphate regulon sensor histidine kinase PhoR [Pseudomonas sp. S 311-6]KAB0545155.1 phosphate regulon sensor histidine kinase PhoR [Kerstersia gyiorum]MCP1632199.1 two-component system phosphate regulon sensor histidine kinase PhoR [Kerstersia gyiorum]MCP1635294.1 two-component system phosphate regulon sensor histidine kinase PhoR [Kerstersia gyiorum]MCP1669779.1 two-component system phosphate regulon sensor hi
MIWIRTLATLLAWAVVAALVHWRLGGSSGMLVFACGAGLQTFRQARQIQRFSQWLKTPESAPPYALGVLDDSAAMLYRYQRRRIREFEENQRMLQGMIAAAQALPDGAVTLNETLHIEWCNRMARRHLGLRLPADRGQYLLNLLREPEFVAYAQQEEWPEPILVRLVREGQERLMMMQLTAYASDQRLLITRDVTQIEKLETTRRDFVANVSHELRTPLTVLSGFLETLRELPAEAIPPEQHDYYLSLMHEQAQRMQTIVADLLTLSALESSPSADPQEISVSELVQAARLQAEGLSAGRHTFSWQIDDSLALLGSETELSSAFTNLLTNAVRYTPDGGTIDVAWRQLPDGGARYSVRDSGIGIAAVHIPRLTERFYRVDRGRSRAVGGTGLGLAITKHIAMRHDAELQIESKPGQGSTFSLVFPSDRIVARR